MDRKPEFEERNAGGPAENVAASLVGQIIQAIRDL
jgi:hypothetical protein